MRATAADTYHVQISARSRHRTLDRRPQITSSRFSNGTCRCPTPQPNQLLCCGRWHWGGCWRIVASSVLFHSCGCHNIKHSNILHPTRWTSNTHQRPPSQHLIPKAAAKRRRVFASKQDPEPLCTLNNTSRSALALSTSP